jgi:hypothetical protein
MRYIIHIQTAQRKSAGAPVSIHGRGLTDTPSGPSEIISGKYKTAKPEIIAKTKRAAAIAELKEQTATARARFYTAKLKGMERPSAPDYTWAEPAPRVQWEDWKIDFGADEKPRPAAAAAPDFSIESGPAYFPTGKTKKNKAGETKPEMLPAGEKAVVTIGQRIYSVLTRSKRVTSRFGNCKQSMPLAQAVKNIARMAGEQAAQDARAAFLAAAPGLE